MNRDSFVFYRSFYEAIKDLPAEDKSKCFDAICEFALNHNTIEISGIPKTVITLIKPNLESNFKKFIAGVEHGHKGADFGIKGGRPKTKPAENPQETVNKPTNVNVNENVNVKEEIKTNLEKSIDSFCDMRKKIKKPLTEFAKKLLIKKLNSLSSDENEQIKIIEQSILNSWQGIFPLKNENAQCNQIKNELPREFKVQPKKFKESDYPEPITKATDEFIKQCKINSGLINE